MGLRRRSHVKNITDALVCHLYKATLGKEST